MLVEFQAGEEEGEEMQVENKVFIIKGDKHKKPEPQHHTIIFPGGHIGVVRTTNNEYWAHVHVNNSPEAKNLDTVGESRHGEIKKIRWDTPEGVKTIEVNTDHFAVLIGLEQEGKK